MKKIIMMMLMLILVASSVHAAVSVTLSKYDPYPATPGQTVKVWLSVQNDGDEDVKDLKVSVQEQLPFTLYNDDDTKTIPIIGAHKEYLLDFNLKVDTSAVEGNNNLHVTYASASGPIQGRDLQVYVQTRDSTLTIENVEMNPSEITPGSDGILTVTVKNNAPTAITDLSMKLQLQTIIGSTLVDLPFAPTDSGSERVIHLLNPGKSTEFSYNLRAYPDAVSKVYKIPFTLSYYDGSGTLKNKTDFIGVIVNGVPDISIIVDDTDITKQKKTGTVTLKIVNKGLSDVKFLNVVLKNNPDFDILSNSDTTYVGNLVSDDYQNAEYKIAIKSSDSSISIPVTLQYRDANNKYYESTTDVTFNLIDEKSLGTGGSNKTWLIILVLIVAGGGYWYYRRSKKKAKK